MTIPDDEQSSCRAVPHVPVIKTTTESLPELEQHIKANDNYETPEIIATEIPGGSREYLG